MGRPPFTRWSDTDHSGPIIITTVLGLVYWLVPGIGQQAITFGRSASFSWADGLYIGSMVMGLAQAILLLVACSRGLGRSASVLDDAQVIDTLRLYHASNILYVLVLGLAKCSTTSSVIKLTVPNRGSIRRALVKYKMVFSVVTGLSAAWTIGSVIALGLQCEVGSTSSSLRNTCEGSMATWVGIFVSDAITDVIIAAFAASIIWPTKALVRLKLLWYTPFTIRLCVIILSGVRLVAYHHAQLNKDPTIAIWLFAILTQIQIFVSLIAAGFPALRKTVLDLVTNFGVSEDSRNRSGKGAAYILSSLTRKSRQKQSQNSNSAFSPYNGSKARASTVIKANMNAQPSDDNSQKGIIRQDEYDVVVTTIDHDR